MKALNERIELWEEAMSKRESNLRVEDRFCMGDHRQRELCESVLQNEMTLEEALEQRVAIVESDMDIKYSVLAEDECDWDNPLDQEEWDNRIYSLDIPEWRKKYITTPFQELQKEYYGSKYKLHEERVRVPLHPLAENITR